MKLPVINCYLAATDGVPRWALKVDDSVIRNDVVEGDANLGLVESISVTYNDLLSSCGISTSQISKFYFILGPGSFTSLRTAYSFLQGLAAPYQTVIVGVSSFLAYFLSTPYEKLVCSKLSLNANREEDFLSEFIIGPNALIEAKIPIAISKGSQHDLIQIPENMVVETLIEGSDKLSLMNEVSLQSLIAAGHLYTGEGKCELLYIKGVSAKTLLERGILS